ncbi:hypothetical protein P3X46_030144 [Hevea brasiliensis]|uniref:Uncharacterized protein n=1 Tax=Hevea brasiliensis TaxID=3981 RepID=A0ABQ9KUG4_HEVBR|nr:uncharacterized protein LOC110656306 [Hevea brasiliensis]KAJ9148048.1 hypothetical protein P3X46_030144 [Hevea brasiliensis]
MEKLQESTNTHQQKPISDNPLVWDCGSTLYDSFELKSFERQLYSAIHSRTLSMPHLPDRRVPVAVENSQPPLPLSLPPSVSKKTSKISRSLNKFLKSMFKSKQNSSGIFGSKGRPGHEYYVVYDKSGALSTIPEVPEIDFGGFSPEINSLVRRTGSERFTASSMMGISCA